MNENINLCEILKGHEGETFWSDVFDLVTLIEVKEDFIIINWGIIKINLYKNGSKIKNERCVLFPSKYQRDWNKWVEEQKNKVPKTWNDIKHCNVEFWGYISQMNHGVIEPILKSVLALLKIHQLIEVGYGGNVTNEEWDNLNTSKYTIWYNNNKKKLEIVTAYYNRYCISFHTEKQANEFLSYPENVQLLKDYFMI